MKNLEPEYLNTLETILKKYLPNHSVWLFGSRTTNHIKPFSDIDLVIKSDGNINSQTMALLQNELDESNIPYKVDLLEWHLLDEAFKQLILKRYEVIV